MCAHSNAMGKAEKRRPVFVVYPAALFDGWAVVKDACSERPQALHNPTPPLKESRMYARQTHVRFCGLAICAVSVFLGASAVLAADGHGPSDARTRYLQERALCDSGQSHQDRATCLREAGAAFDQARRGALNDGPAQYQQNALIRCNPLPPEERSACQARMQGQGLTRGSVTEGGIYRELVTREIPSQDGSVPANNPGGMPGEATMGVSPK